MVGALSMVFKILSESFTTTDTAKGKGAPGADSSEQKPARAAPSDLSNSVNSFSNIISLPVNYFPSAGLISRLMPSAAMRSPATEGANGSVDTCIRNDLRLQLMELGV